MKTCNKKYEERKTNPVERFLVRLGMFSAASSNNTDSRLVSLVVDQKRIGR